jgi:hypothetical protein
MVIRVKGMVINTHDLYYADKFCREHGIEQKIIELDATIFFDNGKHIEYLTPYYITEPHIATHFWLLEQCSHFPVIGGDWPWIQMHKTEKRLSPFKLEFSSYEKFMNDKGMHGIGNMISYSLESSCKMMELHMDSYQGKEEISLFKWRMYHNIKPEIEPRIKAHGWERSRFLGTSLLTHKEELVNRLKPTEFHIKWGQTISNLIGSSTNECAEFS